MSTETEAPSRRGFVSRTLHGIGIGLRQLDVFLVMEVLCLIALMVAIISQMTAREDISRSARNAVMSSAPRPVAPAPTLGPPASLPPASSARPPSPPQNITVPPPAAGSGRPTTLAPAQSTQSGDQSDRSSSLGINGVWKGRYQCSQGETSLLLTVSAVGKALEARFRFETRSGTTGEFRMTGVYSDTERVLVLRPSSWINKPNGFEAVPITAKVDPQFREIVGNIDYPGCSWVRLKRSV